MDRNRTAAGVAGVLLVAGIVGTVALQSGAGTPASPDALERYRTPLEPNRTSIHTECCAPAPFVVETNRYGLREGSFNITPDQGTTRILVIGDAYTWGFGVNASERFTDILSTRLNTELPGTYEVINAGVPNWGMEDYYRYLRVRGTTFNPDIVVIAFIWNDRISAAKLEEVRRRAEMEVDSRPGTLSERRRRELIESTMAWMEQSLYDRRSVAESGFGYLDDIQEVADRNDIRTVYYALDNLSPDVRQYVDAWSRTGRTVVYAPDRFTSYWDFRPADGNRTDPYRVSRWNSDPSAAGHRLLAERLFAALNRSVL